MSSTFTYFTTYLLSCVALFVVVGILNSARKSSVQEEEEAQPRHEHRPPASDSSVLQSVPTNTPPSVIPSVPPTVFPSVPPSVPNMTALQEQYQAEMEQQMKRQVLPLSLKV